MYFRTRALAAVAFTLAFGGGASFAQEKLLQWRVSIQQTAGQSSTGCTGGMAWVREGNGKFGLWNNDNHIELWTLAQSPDGAARGTAYSSYSKSTLRLDIAGPVGPREFEIVNETKACRFKVTPLKN